MHEGFFRQVTAAGCKLTRDVCLPSHDTWLVLVAAAPVPMPNADSMHSSEEMKRQMKSCPCRNSRFQESNENPQDDHCLADKKHHTAVESTFHDLLDPDHYGTIKDQY